MVPVSSSLSLYNALKNKRVNIIIINGYYHDVFKGRKVNNICKEIKKFLLKSKFRIKKKKIEL